LLLQILILFLVAVVATRSMWEAHALLAGHSARKDLARLVEFDSAIRAGNFFPAWPPDLYAGYGSPIFQFYAPLTYYITEVPVLTGFDYATALKLTQLLALFFSGLAMYRLVSTDFSGWVACLGGVFYMVAPYRLVNMFVRHALAEHCAFIWLPLIVWGTEQFVSKTSRIGLVTGALATAALIFTHNIMALIGLPVCVAAGWALASPKGARWISAQSAKSGSASPKDASPARTDGRGTAEGTNIRRRDRTLCQRVEDNTFHPEILSLAAAGAVAMIGIGLAAFFWWPAISGRLLTYAEVSLTTGYYDFHRHFVEGWQLLDLHWKFGISASDASNNSESIRGQMPLQICLPHLFAGLGRS
jgi:6-pyruvoyl-tetrahydropterin synthase-like protein